MSFFCCIYIHRTSLTIIIDHCVTPEHYSLVCVCVVCVRVRVRAYCVCVCVCVTKPGADILQVCFNCRQPGHRVGDCPLDSHSAGICFKCGSSDHTCQQCRLKIPPGESSRTCTPFIHVCTYDEYYLYVIVLASKLPPLIFSHYTNDHMSH